MGLTHEVVVLRPFPGPGGKTLQIGERHNATGWKNREALLAQRYIRPYRGSKRVQEEEFTPPPDPHRKKKLPQRHILGE